MWCPPGKKDCDFRCWCSVMVRRCLYSTMVKHHCSEVFIQYHGPTSLSKDSIVVKHPCPRIFEWYHGQTSMSKDTNSFNRRKCKLSITQVIAGKEPSAILWIGVKSRLVRALESLLGRDLATAGAGRALGHRTGPDANFSAFIESESRRTIEFEH